MLVSLPILPVMMMVVVLVVLMVVVLVEEVEVVDPLLLRFQVSQLSTTSSPHCHQEHRALTCRRVPQIPLHLRESHLGQVQRCSVPLQEGADLREARAERRAGATQHHRSSHLSRRRGTGGEGPLLGCDCVRMK